MSVNCPHCRADIGKSKEPSEFPWEDGEFREMTCDSCGKEFLTLAVTDIRWQTFKDDEQMDLLL